MNMRIRLLVAILGLVPLVSIAQGEHKESNRRLEQLEKLSFANTKEVSDAAVFLDEYLRNPEKYVPGPEQVARAALLLVRIDPGSEIAKLKLADLMDFVRESDDSAPDYLGIARALAKMGPKATPLYPALMLDALTDYEAANRKIAINALSRIMPSRPGLIATLRRIQVRNWEINVLIANITPADRELRAEIALALRHPYPSLRERALTVISVIRSPDKIMLAELEALKSDPDAKVRKKALETWESIRNAR